MGASLIYMNICAKSSLTNQVTTIFSQPQRLLIAPLKPKISTTTELKH